MSRQKERQSDLAVLWQLLDEQAKKDEERIQFWKDWVQDKEEKLKAPSSKDEVIMLNLLRERGMVHHAIWINERVSLIFFKMVAIIMSMQDDQMRRLERRRKTHIPKKELDEMRELRERNTKALEILEAEYARQRAILERESTRNVV